MPTCDHVAFVLADLEPALAVLRALDLPVGPVEEFPGEGTREVYVGEDGQAARLLLMQPLGAEGPYARALAKRGPGLHHLAFRAPDAKAFVAERPGWFLIPQSLELYEASRTVWLARPGVGALIEVQEGEGDGSTPPLVERVEVVTQDPEQAAALLAGLSGPTTAAVTEAAPTMTVSGREVPVGQLLGKQPLR